jgi:hypothetical protein
LCCIAGAMDKWNWWRFHREFPRRLADHSTK